MYDVEFSQRNFKVGDIVKVYSRPDEKITEGWSDMWTNGMDQCIGCIYRVSELDTGSGVGITQKGINIFNVDETDTVYYFPYQALMKVQFVMPS